LAELPKVPPVPHWVRSEARAVEGLDLLGLRAPVARIGAGLLTGITTISPMVRYVGLRAWVARRYALARLPDSWKSFGQFAGRIEAAVALGNLLLDRQVGGAVGHDAAVKLINSGKDPIELAPLVKQLAVSAYAGPSDELGISGYLARRPSEIPLLSEERGVSLANAVDSVLGDTELGRTAASAKQESKLSRADLIIVGKAFPIGMPSETERRVLADCLIPETVAENRENKDGLRVATYGLLLEAAESHHRVPRESDLFSFATSIAHDLQPGYQSWLNGWLLYLVRDQIAAVHEAAMSEVVEELTPSDDEPHARIAREVVSKLLGQTAELEQVLESLSLLPTTRKPLQAPLAVLLELIRKATPGRTIGPPVRWHGALQEPAVMNLALELARDKRPGCLVLLPVSWLLTSERLGGVRSADSVLSSKLSVGGSRRLGVSQVVLPVLKEMLQRNATIVQAAYELTVRTVDQHLATAWERMLREPEKDVAIIHADDNTWSYRKPFKAGRTASRLDQAIGWLRQLALVDDLGCTAEGRRYLARARELLAACGDWA